MAELTRRWRLAAMVAGTLVWAIAAAIGAVASIFSVLIFDNRANLLNPVAWLATFLLVTFWIVCILAPFGAWIAYRRGQESLAAAAMAAPLAWLVLLIALVQFIPS